MGTPRRDDLRPFRVLCRDQVLLAQVVFTAVVCALFAAFAADHAAQVRIFWFAQVPLDVALGVGAWRLRQMVPQPYRRFWASIAFAGASFSIGDSYQSVSTVVTASPALSGGVVQSSFFIAGMGSIILACLLFPRGLRSRREEVVFWLDACTVLVGGGVMTWCFAVNPVGGRTDQVTASVTAALVIAAGFAATKVALIAAPPMARVAALPMIAAPLAQTVGIFLPGVLEQDNHAYIFALRFLPSLLIALGPRIQELTVRIDGTHTRPRRKAYSLLPYTMLAATFAMFLAMLPDRVSTQLWGAVAGIVVITSMVAVRQLISFQDNDRLLRRLDVALGELKDREILLREQASFDSLTKLANRAYFHEAMARTLTGADGDGTHAVLLIDLDDFKTINDTMGHAAGDALLVQVAARLRDAVRPGDVVARLGGDEFAVLLPGADSAIAGLIAEGLLRRIAENVEVDRHVVATRASIGAACARTGDDPSTLLSNADIAMYEAKNLGKAAWVLYREEMGTRIGAEADLVRDLAVAVEAGQLALVYQPIVRLADLEMTGAEALIRWHHPTRGLLKPEEFIPVAERSGQILEIGRWALREACRQAVEWRHRHPNAESMKMSVNVAGRQLRTVDLVGDVIGALTASGLPASCLTIEVTETAVLGDEQSDETMLRLRELGIELALDDFGTAASTLGLLLTCPATTLKLDRSFVESITTVGRQAAVAAAVSHISTALRMTSVAEGIETREQLARLRDLGYDYGQGYLFSPPLPPDEMDRLWADPAPLTRAATGRPVRHS